jgi:predicted nucleic acid-binding protein
MVVVDASVIVRGLDRDGPAPTLLVDGDARAPHLAHQEVAQALRGQVLPGLMSTEAAEARLLRRVRLGLRRHPSVALLPRIWSLRTSLTADDATYVALAEVLECPLATADTRLAEAPGPACEIIRVAA